MAAGARDWEYNVSLVGVEGAPPHLLARYVDPASLNVAINANKLLRIILKLGMRFSLPDMEALCGISQRPNQASNGCIERPKPTQRNRHHAETTFSSPFSSTPKKRGLPTKSPFPQLVASFRSAVSSFHSANIFSLIVPFLKPRLPELTLTSYLLIQPDFFPFNPAIPPSPISDVFSCHCLSSVIRHNTRELKPKHSAVKTQDANSTGRTMPIISLFSFSVKLYYTR